MTSKLTIVLFLKERKYFNKRFLDYYCERNLDFNLLISDGSKKPIDRVLLNKIKKNKLIKYFKFSEDKSYNIFYKKIYKTLKLVKTKYVFFASNDDFIVYQTLKKCVDFLKYENKFIGCGGTMLGFDMLKKNKLDYKLSNFYHLYNYIKLDHLNKVDRFENFIKNHNDLPKNCVMKTKVLLKTYKYSSNLFNNNVDFKDDFSCLYNVSCGRIKILNRPLILHQAHLDSEANNRGNMLKPIFVNKNFINDLIIFDKIIGAKLQLKKYVVMNKYYSHVLTGLINTLDHRTEPSIKEIKNIFIKKLLRRILKTKVKKANYISRNLLNLETKNSINKIEKYLKNSQIKNL